jgi:hypothetical protein
MSKGFFSSIIEEVKGLFSESKPVEIVEIETDASQLALVGKNDEELVAVLTAAIMAYGYTDFKIKAVKPVVNKIWRELARTENGKQPFKR